MQTLDSLTKALGILRQTPEMVELHAAIAQVMRDLADLLDAPPSEVLTEPHYHTVEDYRGDPFSSGKRIPYRKGSACYRALAIFGDCSNPITRTRFVELGGRPQDLERLLKDGKLVKLEG